MQLKCFNCPLARTIHWVGHRGVQEPKYRSRLR